MAGRVGVRQRDADVASGKGIRAAAEDRVGTRRVPAKHRLIGVDALGQPGPLGAHITQLKQDGSRQLLLDAETPLLVIRVDIGFARAISPRPYGGCTARGEPLGASQCLRPRWVAVLIGSQGDHLAEGRVSHERAG